MSSAFSHIERRLLLEGIFFLATEKGERDFPSEERFAYDLLVHGILGYVGIPHVIRLASEHEMWELYSKGVEEAEKKLQLRIKDAFEKMLKPEYRPSLKPAEFYEHFSGSWGMPGICNKLERDALTFVVAKWLPSRDRFLESLMQEERTDVKGVATFIARYLKDED